MPHFIGLSNSCARFHSSYVQCGPHVNLEREREMRSQRSQPNAGAGRHSNDVALVSLAVTLLVAVIGAGLVARTDAAAVMSIDLGSEWLKVGVVAPKVPMEIALNKESKRKTPAVIAFRDGQRIFGEDAQTIGLRFPEKSYGYVTDLLGKRIDNPIVKLYSERFPYHKIEQDGETIVFRPDEETTYTVEELVAQFIQKARDSAEAATNQNVTECVLIVPGFFGQAERRAVLAAANLANIKVLQLINDYTAVALNYGIFARKDFNETAQYYMFYDMGAAKTSAAVVSYQLVKDKVTREIQPVIQVLGVGYDRTLGGLEMQLRLRDHLAGEFNKLGKTKTDVRTNARAMAKLFKEAGRVKNVLSANANHYAQIEGLLEEIDFKVQVTRDEFEALCTDLFARVAAPLEAALRSANLPLSLIRQVILFGGGTRVPKVQEHLRAAIDGAEPGKNINMDEAAAMGAVYRAADLATGFKVRKFVTRDAAVFPVHVTFDKGGQTDEERAAGKQVRRTLFGAMNPYPQKKVITFNKHAGDFAFGVHYADLEHLGSDAEREALGDLHLARVELNDVERVLALNAGEERTESKGIKAHFALDDSGVFEITNVELVLEQTIVEDGDESPLSKLGSTISKLFASEAEEGGVQAETDEEGAGAAQTGGADAEAAAADEEGAPKEDAEGSGDGAASADGAGAETDGEKASADAAETTDSADADAAKGTADEAKNDADAAAANKSESAAATPRAKVVTVRHQIPNTVHNLFAPTLSGDQLATVRERIDVIAGRERDVLRRETALNALESHIVDWNQKLEEAEYADCATADEAKAIRAANTLMSEWLYDEGEFADADTYEKRLLDLQTIAGNPMMRHWEHSQRSETIKLIEKMLFTSWEFLEQARNFTKDKNPERDIFTPVEIESLEKTLREAQEWLDAEIEAQSLLKKSQNVRLTVKAIMAKMFEVDRDVKYLVNKMKLWKPKAPKKTKKEKKEKKAEKDEPEDIVAEPEPEAAKPIVEDDVQEKEAQTPTTTQTPEEDGSATDGAGEVHSEL